MSNFVSHQISVASETTVLSTGLNSLANNALALSAVQAMLTGGNYLSVEVEFSGSFGTAPLAGTGLALWFVRAIDGTPTWEDGGEGTIVPARAPDAVLPVRVVTTAQRIVREFRLPPRDFRVLLRNDGTGQALAASGNTIRIRPVSVVGRLA